MDTEKLRGKLEKIAWKHYDPESSINVEEMLDEMMPVLLQREKEVLTEIEKWVEDNKWDEYSDGGLVLVRAKDLLSHLSTINNKDK